MSEGGAVSKSGSLDGIWRLVSALSWGPDGTPLPPPYGSAPLGTVQIQNGRMLAVLCDGDQVLSDGRAREYVSYGGPCSFDGGLLTTRVDLSARADWLDGVQARDALLDGDRLVLRPPLREYGGILQQRELVWERVWTPASERS